MFSSRIRPSSPVITGLIILSLLLLLFTIVLSRTSILRSAPDSSITAPGTAAQAGAQAEPTAQPLPTATVAPHPGEGLVGPEWNIASGGDINQDGIRDVVAFRWPSFPIDSPIWQQSQAQYPTHSIVSSEIVIVQEGAANSPQTLLRADTSGITVGSETLVAHPPGAVSGYLLAINPSSRVPISLVPIRADLSGFEPMVGIYWAHPTGPFQIFAGGQL